MRTLTTLIVLTLLAACSPLLDNAALQGRKRNFCTVNNEAVAMQTYSVMLSSPGKAYMRRERWEIIGAQQQALLREWAGLCSTAAVKGVVEVWITKKEEVVEKAAEVEGQSSAPVVVESAKPAEKVAEYDVADQFKLVLPFESKIQMWMAGAALLLLGAIAVGVNRGVQK